MKRLHLLLFGVVLLIPGVCIGCEKQAKEHALQSPPPAQSHAEAVAGQALDGRSATPAAKADAEEVKKARQNPGKPTTSERKIIFNDDVRLTVKDFAKAELELQQLLETHKGYPAVADVSGTTGGKQQGTWKLRVPVATFTQFREAVKKLGELVRYTADSKDVTDEFFDLEVRIKNKESELEAYRKIYDKINKPEEMAPILQHLKRTELELDQLKGRQRLLENQTSYATLTVTMQERDVFQPPTPLPPPEVATFGATVEKTFFGSVDVLVAVGKAVALLAVAVAPWLPILLVVAATAWVFVRRRRPAVSTATPSPSK